MGRFDFIRHVKPQRIFGSHKDFGLQAEDIVCAMAANQLFARRLAPQLLISTYAWQHPNEVPGSREFSIGNAREGDLFFLQGCKEVLAIEVKSSPSYQNVSFDPGELAISKASILMAYTPDSPVKFWMTEMYWARMKARDVGGSDFVIVPYNEVPKLRWDDVIDWARYGRRDIPF